MNILSNGVATHDGDDIVNPWILERGLCYDMMVRPSILPLIAPGDWVVDGGAAIGDHTCAYLEAVGPLGKVFAFEPGRNAFECLVYNCPSAVAINRFLYNERTSLYLCLSRQNMGGSHTMYSQPPEGVEYDGPIETVVLDDYGLRRLDMLKLDIEGFEYFALLGAENTIMRCRPKIILEMNSAISARVGTSAKDIYGLLSKWNYRHYTISGNTEQFCSNCDIACIPL
jgi:FkbM family methyltransferase